ncbi:secreted RxLR effector protein 161-like [Nicotiana tomentosiformis]|uniref:secreted RxLR effector protein 161-like n=1 Tax=Nicotiana tomentosiformis TaxID=4098 RepID=UPI00388C8E3E
MYLANATRPDIAFSVDLLARYSSSPIRRYWNGIKHILRYLKGTLDMDLFYANKDGADLVGYADAVYFSYVENLVQNKLKLSSTVVIRKSSIEQEVVISKG